MTNQKANELIKLGAQFETDNPERASVENGVFAKSAGFKEIPGLGEYYQNGSLKHKDVRSLFLMTLGCVAEYEESK